MGTVSVESNRSAIHFEDALGSSNAVRLWPVAYGPGKSSKKVCARMRSRLASSNSKFKFILGAIALSALGDRPILPYKRNAKPFSSSLSSFFLFLPPQDR